MPKHFSRSTSFANFASYAASTFVLLFGVGLAVVHSQSTGCTPNPFQISSNAGSSFTAAGGSTTLTWTKPTGGSLYCPSVAATDAPWILIATPNSASTNGQSSVTVQANNAAARSGGITVKSNSSDATLFTINQAGPSVPTSSLQVQPPTLTFNGVQDTGALPQQTIAITANSATGFTVVSSAAFLTVSAASGNTPANLTVTANSATLAPGTYTGTLTITPSGGGTPAQVSVSMVLTARPFTATPSSLLFNYAGGAAPPAKTFTVAPLITTADGGSFTAAASGGSWLSVGAGPYTATSTISVAVDPSGLAAGNYSGKITLTAPDSYGIAPGIVPVTLTVGQSSPLTLSCTPLAGPTSIKTLYISTCVAAGGVAPYSWSISAGTLPPGMSTSGTTGSAIIVGGIPTATGSYSYTVKVTDNAQQTQTQVYSGTLTQSAPANLTASPASLTFNMKANDATPPAAQSISVFGSATASFTAAATGGNWLIVNPGAAQTPGSLSVTINPTGMVAGVYSGQIVITGTNTTPATITVPVTLNIAAVAPPILSVSPTAVLLSYVQGASAEQRGLVVSNLGAGTLPFSATAQTSTCGSWLTIQNPSGNAPGLISFLANPGGQPIGTCTGQITVNSGTNQSQSIPITMVISGTAQSLQLSQSALEFQATAQSGTPPTQTFNIVNTGTGSMNWSIDTSSLPSWASVTPGIGTATPSAPVSVLVNPQGLSPGRYYGTILVTAPTAGNSPKAVTLALTIPDAGQFPAPQVSPHGLILAGGASQNLTLLNQSSVPLNFTSTVFTEDGQPWLAQAPPAGIVAANSTLQMSVTANVTGLSPGLRRGKLRIGFADGTVRTVGIVLAIAGTGGSCNPNTDLAVTIQTPEDNFTGTAQTALTLQAAATDCTGKPAGDSASGDVVVSVPNQVPLVLPLTNQGGGILTATWTPPALAAGVTVTARVYQGTAGGVLYGSYSVSGNVSAAPANAAAAITVVENAAANNPPDIITPGAWVEIKGTQLAGQTLVSSTLPYPKTLANTQVLVQNQPLPLYYVSQTQINALMPAQMNTGKQEVIVVRDGTRSAGYEVLVMQRQPGIFTVDATGQGQGSIVNATTGVIAGPGAPIKRGDFISIYGTGLGPVNGAAPADGAVTPIDPLLPTVDTPAISIGGVGAASVFSGLAPSLVGVYQINVKVPDSVTPGFGIPVTVTVGGIQSNTVTIAVQ